MADQSDMLATSGDYAAMLPYWQRVADITEGVEALRRRPRVYLPQFPNESAKNYAYRNANSKFSDIFSDIVESLSSKPFSREVGLANESVQERVAAVVEDADRTGNHLHVFAQDVFHAGIANAIDWILVDHTKAPATNTVAEERKAGSRPYLVRIPALNMLAVYSGMHAGREVFTYAKIDETRTVVKGGKEMVVPRVRILARDELTGKDGEVVGYGHPRFEVWEKPAGADAWALVDQGALSIAEIPLVPFFTGRRKPGTWQITTPLKRVADLQIEHYQQETNLKSAKELTAFPVFKGEGVSPPVDAEGKPVSIPLGPSTMLWAPLNDNGHHGSYGILEISATSLQFLSAEIDKTEAQMRELGRQPLTSGTSGITQVAAAFASQRSASAVQAWAFLLKDALEKSLRYAAQWMGDTLEPVVYVHTDFAIELGADKAPELLAQMKKDGDLSLATLWDELKRRAILSPEFNADDEAHRLLDEVPAGNQ